MPKADQPRPADQVTSISNKHIREIQSFYDTIWKDRDHTSEVFYRNLFELEPEVKHLFRGDMAEQRRQLMAALGYIITNLEMPDVILPSIKRLARDHVKYGVVPRHYESVGQAMTRTLEEIFGSKFTPGTRDAWRDAYQEISCIMIAEAYRPQD